MNNFIWVVEGGLNAGVMTQCAALTGELKHLGLYVMRDHYAVIMRVVRYSWNYKGKT